MASPSPPRISLIVAMSPDGVIGRSGRLPWRLSTDLQRFKRLTWDHTIIMGRRTFVSLNRILPHRRHVVLTRRADFDIPSVLAAHSWPEALRLSADDDQVFVIGGGEVYRLAQPSAQRAYVTEVECQVEGDTFFDSRFLADWRLEEESYFPAGPNDAFPHWFRVYDRIDLPSARYDC